MYSIPLYSNISNNQALKEWETTTRIKAANVRESILSTQGTKAIKGKITPYKLQQRA